MKAVFDLDDTICRHEKRDFENAKPITETINKMKRLKKEGVAITIYTARGQNSCKGNIEKIKAKYDGQIKRWLDKYEVPYDELVFGKPLADIYVDDKGISLKDFLDADIRKLKGNSGAQIYKHGNYVTKECGNAWETNEWFKKAEAYGINCPKVQAVVLDKITMDYCGEEIKKITIPIIQKILSTIYTFKRMPHGTPFDTDALISRAEEHLKDKAIKHRFDKTKSVLQENRQQLKKETSFCHGDMTISNCLIKNGSIYLIDPNQKEKYSSYLIDLAKLKFSLNGGEMFLKGKEPAGTKQAAGILEQELKKTGTKQIADAIEITHWIRLLKYTDSEEKVKAIIETATRLEKSI